MHQKKIKIGGCKKQPALISSALHLSAFSCICSGSPRVLHWGWIRRRSTSRVLLLSLLGWLLLLLLLLFSLPSTLLWLGSVWKHLSLFDRVKNVSYFWTSFGPIPVELIYEHILELFLNLFYAPFRAYLGILGYILDRGIKIRLFEHPPQNMTLLSKEGKLFSKKPSFRLSSLNL